MFGLDSALSLSKGCYRGQEIVARILHRGHLDRRLGGVAVDHHEPPAPGSEIRSQGDRIGAVTSSIVSPRLRKALALAVLKIESLQPGTPVTVVSGTVELRAEVVALPLQ
jgi:folate-binding Fe-S cluster repair protein YgfZ